MPESILEEAAELINGDRAKDYGPVTENFTRISELWSTYKGYEFSAHDVSMMMILVKVARQSSGYHRDSAVDIAGYAALDEKVNEGPSRILGEEFYPGERFDTAGWLDNLLTWPNPFTPRKWNSLNDIPEGVTVIDNEGDHWKMSADDEILVSVNDRESWSHTEPEDRPEDDEAYRPFTEVLS